MSEHGPDIDGGHGSSESGGGTEGKSDSTLMLILSYVWLLCLIPLLTVKDDEEVQWHAKHGTVLFAIGFGLGIFFMFLNIFGGIVPFLICLTGPVGLLVWLGLVIVHIVAIVKAINGERLLLPFVSDLPDKF